MTDKYVRLFAGHDRETHCEYEGDYHARAVHNECGGGSLFADGAFGARLGKGRSCGGGGDGGGVR